MGLWTLSRGAPTGQSAAVLNAPSGTLAVATALDDVVLAAGFSSHTGNSITTTWSGAGVTERYDAQIESVFNAHSGADAVAAGASTEIGFSNDVATTQRAHLAVAYA